MFKTTLTVSIDIERPLDEVWRILTDFERYPQWNAFTPHVVCSKVVGDPVILLVRLREDSKLSAVHLTLNHFEDSRAFCWGSQSWALRANRCQSVEALGANRTRYQSAETFSGLLVPVVMILQRRKLMRGYESAAQGLKAYLETGETRTA